MDGFLQNLGAEFGVIAFSTGLMIGLVAIAVAWTLVARARERTRREVAAYVAEGSITVEEAERILGAASPHAPSACARVDVVRSNSGAAGAPRAVEAPARV